MQTRITAIVALAFLVPPHFTLLHAAEPPTAAATLDAAQGGGIVVRIDAPARIVHIRHDPIPALKWPAMAMDFRVTDSRLLARLKPGQAVRFTLVREPTTGYVISRIEVSK